MKRLFLVGFAAALAAAAAGCGGDDAPDAVECVNHCDEEWQTQCAGDLAQTCEADENGCLFWADPSPCPNGSLCRDGACQALPACGPHNCAGCCFNGQCVAGTAPAACGTGGAQCVGCASNQTCSAFGTCEAASTACGPSTCAGCCFNGQCQTGTAPSACGKGGAACITCASGQVCSSAQVCEAAAPTCSASNCAGCCLDGQCQTGTANIACGSGGAQCVACGMGQVCKLNQACGVDPESRWKVQPVSAVIANTNNGAAWDGDGSGPDVKITMQCPPSSAPVSGATPVVQDSWQPHWSTGGCVTTASALLAEPWRFWAWDSDLTSDDPITEELNLQFTEESFAAGGWSGPGYQGLTTLSVQLQRQ